MRTEREGQGVEPAPFALKKERGVFMRIKVNKKKVIGAFRQALRAVNPRNPRVALTGLKIEAAQDGNITVTGVDESFFVACKAPAEEVAEPGAVVLPGAMAVSLIEKLPGEEFTLEASGSSASLRYDSSEAVLNTFALDDFQEPPEVGENGAYVVSSELCGVLGRVLPAAGGSGAWSGVCFDFKEDELVLAASDTYRLSVGQVPQRVERKGVGRILVPKRAAEEIRRLFGGADDAVVVVSVGASGNAASFSGSSATLVTALLHGEFAEYEDRIKEWKKGITTKLVADPGILLAALERARVVAFRSEKEAVLATLHVEGGRLEVTAEGGGGKFREPLEAKVSGEDVTVSFNVDYLATACKSAVYQDGEVLVGITGERGPALVVPVAGKNEAGGRKVGKVLSVVLPAAKLAAQASAA